MPMASPAPDAPKSVLDLFSLKGRRALVTGGHMGLGITMARALADAGADVALASRTHDSCVRAAEELTKATGRKSAGFKVDVASASDVATTTPFPAASPSALMTIGIERVCR